MTKQTNILLGVTGGIAAYKAAELTSRLFQLGYNVKVIMTENACQLIGPATFRALSHNPVATDLFAAGQNSVPHISLAAEADILIIAPATANTIAKLALGLADNLLTTTALACTAPKIIVPAMNEQMWQNPLVQKNIATLSANGWQIIEPDTGNLACGTAGKGRYPDNEIILTAIKKNIG